MRRINVAIPSQQSIIGLITSRKAGCQGCHFVRTGTVDAAIDRFKFASQPAPRFLPVQSRLFLNFVPHFSSVKHSRSGRRIFRVIESFATSTAFRGRFTISIELLSPFTCLRSRLNYCSRGLAFPIKSFFLLCLDTSLRANP